MKQLFILCLFLVGACATELPPQFACAPDHDGLSVPDGFCVIVVADSLGRGRHLTVRDNGDVYVALREPIGHGGVAALRDHDGDGTADLIEYFGEIGGTAIGLRDGWIYFGADDQIIRYPLDESEFIPASAPEVAVSGFLEQNSHAAKPFEFDEAGNLYVNIGGPSNACQEMRRTPESPGVDPCPQLDYFGGIWRVTPSILEQNIHEEGTRYATGIRHGVANAWHQGHLFVVQHGRDDLHRLWPDRFEEHLNNELPAEEFFLIREGGDYGWPYCYYDPVKGAKKLSPEYGGNGDIVGRCSEASMPIYGFPAHWAPNDLMFYTGTQFPEKYRGGAFIAFHGSWNRSPNQDGFQVTFLPMENTEVTGEPEIFAGGFVGSNSISTSSEARARPTGLAMGPDGSMYISDSVNGRIWRIIYTGNDG
ncbi:MAG: PQQ-dependent sugar dehydrogenase [Bacteroidetes bacterium]|nr:PQQ-dependent sugar dehydrogenase [Bacteroidota bacterium]